MKNAKMIEWLHAYQIYANTYNVKILNSFYSEVQIKDIEFATRNNLVDLLTELKRFKFVTSLVLGLKKIKKWWWDKA